MIDDSVICSQNEITSVLYKAAVGSGLPVGQAQDVAEAGAWLCATGQPGVALVLQSLNQDLAAWCSAFDLVASGAKSEVVLESAHPTEVLAAMAALAGRSYGVSYHLAEIDGAVVVTCTEGAPEAQPLPGPVEVAEQDLETARQLAHRTYVPASEASRLSGAGAGLTDND